MIKLKDNGYGIIIFHGSKEVRDYFDPYMDKDVFNDTFCYCGVEEHEWNAWTTLPQKQDFTKQDWKIVVEGFRHFGVDLEKGS
jgi:hypothetical protein